MTLTARLPLVLLLPLTGCLLLGADQDTTPPPPPLTVQFVADAYLQDCDWSGDFWLGVESLELTLEHDLDGHRAVELPAPGTCVDGLELFSADALQSGDDLPGLFARPLWEGPLGSGSLKDIVPGLWHADAFHSPDRCGTLDESLGEGVALTEAGVVSGLASPVHGSLAAVTADGERFTDHAPVQVGDTVELAWEADGWDETFVQVRRLHDGEARQTITCGVSSEGGFTVDDTVWDLVNDAVFAQDTQIYVGLVRRSEVELEDGSARATVLTRAMHVLQP